MPPGRVITAMHLAPRVGVRAHLAPAPLRRLLKSPRCCPTVSCVWRARAARAPSLHSADSCLGFDPAGEECGFLAVGRWPARPASLS
eukprot:1732437-Prymnesium_polylepis.1